MSDNKLNLHKIKVEAKERAIISMKNLFRHPNQLEKIQQYRKVVIEKKLRVQTELKSKWQLNDMEMGLIEFHNSVENINDMKNNGDILVDTFSDVSMLSDKLNEIRDENKKHSIYTMVRQHIRCLNVIPKIVNITKNYIKESKLFEAHQCLRELEKYQDKMICDFNNFQNNSDEIWSPLFFDDITQLSTLLKNELTSILSNIINVIKNQPETVVVALRIIEIEEKADKEAVEQGRPKKWKEMLFKTLENTIETKIQALEFDRKMIHNWLTQYLELIRQTVLQDLQLVENLFVPCFPPNYNIIEFYKQTYHICLSKQFEKLTKCQYFGDKEYMFLFSWIQNIYISKDFLGNQAKTLNNVLPQDTIEKFQSSFLNTVACKFSHWIKNSIKTVKEEWYLSVKLNPKSCRTTATSIMLFEMIKQNLYIAKTVSDDFTKEMLFFSAKHVIVFEQALRLAILEYTTNYYRNRKCISNFAHYTIINTNNCSQIIDLSSEIEKQYLNITLTDETIHEQFNEIKEKFIQLRNETIRWMIDEPLTDLNQDFEKLFTSEWLNSKIIIDRICATFKNFLENSTNLTNENFKLFYDSARLAVIKVYITPLFLREFSFQNRRGDVGKQIFSEADQLKNVFLSFNKNVSDNDEDPIDALYAVSDIISCDIDLLSFELFRHVSYYSDISDEQLKKLLGSRGDLTKSEIEEHIANISRSSERLQNSVFQQLFT